MTDPKAIRELARQLYLHDDDAKACHGDAFEDAPAWVRVSYSQTAERMIAVLDKNGVTVKAKRKVKGST